MKENIRTIFFDLDHTLWDFETNSSEALKELVDATGVRNRMNGEVDDFIHRYKAINHEYWEAYRKGEMEKSELRIGRFRESLTEFGIEDPNIHEEFAQGYIRISPEKTNLFPNAISTLEYLFEKYPIYIITNGFEEVQWRKIRNCGIEKYFKAVITSEMAGVKKPHQDIFKYAMAMAKAVSTYSVMIGDEPSIDIQGAYNCGMRSVYFDPHFKNQDSKADVVIRDLCELKRIL